MVTYAITVNGVTSFNCLLPDEDSLAGIEQCLRDGTIIRLKIDDTQIVMINGKTVVTIEAHGPLPSTIAMH